jgi:hypothetical protein
MPRPASISRLMSHSVISDEYVFLDGAWPCAGALRVTDPYYAKDMADHRLAGVVRAVPGPWKGCAVVGDISRRVDTLIAWAAETPFPGPHAGWVDAGFAANVVTGRCGVFDEGAYPAGPSTGEPSDKGSFYGRVCELTAAAACGLVDPGPGPVGVVSLAAYCGHGVYTVHVRAAPSGEADAIRVTFIEPFVGDPDNELIGYASSDSSDEYVPDDPDSSSGSC